MAGWNTDDHTMELGLNRPQQHHVFGSSSLPLYPHSHVGDQGLIPNCDFAPLPNGRQQMSISQVLQDNHYIQMSHVTAVVALQRTLTANWPRVQSLIQDLRPFTSNGDISI